MLSEGRQAEVEASRSHSELSCAWSTHNHKPLGRLGGCLDRDASTSFGYAQDKLPGHAPAAQHDNQGVTRYPKRYLERRLPDHGGFTT